MINIQTMFIFIIYLSYNVYALEDPINMIVENGYPAEKHLVTSKDGYITVLHRIPHGINNIAIGEPVLVAHGLGSSSADFLCLGPKRAFGYILADAGYDVWLGNSRGNSYSIQAAEPSPTLSIQSLKTYYNYSFHEIGIYDYAAQIDYILEKTNKEKLFYFAHSQGGTAFYALMAKMPEYNKKIRLASLLASPAMMDHTDTVIRAISQFIYPLEDLGNTLFVYRVPFMAEIRDLILLLCSIPLNNLLCRGFMDLLVGYDDYKQLNTEIFPIIFKNFPSDLSLKCAYHYLQIIKEGVFQEYNYGREGNLNQYGADKPPAYNLTAVTAPVAIYYGKNDQYVHEEDINTVTSMLPNVVKKYVVPWDKWNHGDFLMATDVVSLLYDEVLKIMNDF